MSFPSDDWSLLVCKVITLSILVYTRVESVGVELVTAVKYFCCATRIRKCNASTISTSFLISFVSHCKWPLVDLQFASILLAVDEWIVAYVQGDYALNASIYIRIRSVQVDLVATVKQSHCGTWIRRSWEGSAVVQLYSHLSWWCVSCSAAMVILSSYSLRVFF